MNRATSAIGLAISGTFLVLPLATSANLLFNGSFEQGNFSPNADSGTTQLYDGSTAIAGWTVSGGGGGKAGDIAWESSANPWGFRASNGDKFLDLTGYVNDSNQPHGGIGLSQGVTVTRGQSYLLTFDVGSSRAYSDSQNPVVTVTVNGTPASYTFTGDVNLSDTLGANNHWQQASFVFTADSTTANISFLAMTAAYDRVIDLDNVSLTAIPEPSSILGASLLLGLPLGASTIRILRRR